MPTDIAFNFVEWIPVAASPFIKVVFPLAVFAERISNQHIFFAPRAAV